MKLKEAQAELNLLTQDEQQGMLQDASQLNSATFFEKYPGAYKLIVAVLEFAITIAKIKPGLRIALQALLILIQTRAKTIY